MPNPRETEVPAISAKAVIENKVTAIHTNPDAVSKEGYDSVTWYDRIVRL